MALYATNRFPGDGATTSYEFNFVGGYLNKAHVKAYQENAARVRQPVPINPNNFVGPYTLAGLPVTPIGSTLVIYRDTPKPPLVDFADGSRVTELNLDTAARQGLFVAAEALDAATIGTQNAAEDVAAALAHRLAAAAAADRSKSYAALAGVFAGQAGVSAAGAHSASQTADAAAGIAARAAGVATTASISATAAADDASASAAQSESIASALASGTIGFSAPAYDFGYVRDASTYFNRDFGSIVGG